MDINGLLKGMEILMECYEEVVEDGVFFDGFLIFGFEGIEDSDFIFKVDFSIYVEILWEGIGRVYGYIYKGDEFY